MNFLWMRWSLSLAILLLASTVSAGPVMGQDPVYYLPVPAGTSVYVTQGNETGALGGDHTGTGAYAYDFALEGNPTFPVAAARGGTVQDLRTDVADGNCPFTGQSPAPACWADVNYVVIDHGDGTAALYMHLAPGSSAHLAPDDVVAAGETIGTAANSGWSSANHLHFAVVSSTPAPTATPWWRETIGPIGFADASVLAAHPDGVPGKGLTNDGPFVSENSLVDPAPATTTPNVSWSREGTKHAAHVPFGVPVQLAAKVRDAIELRFLAYYADWPNTRDARRLDGFDPRRTWRVLAVCRPRGTEGELPTHEGCRWEGDTRSATVRFRWDATGAERRRTVPGLPRANAAITQGDDSCVPVTLGIEVYNAAGTMASAPRGRIARRCDAAGEELGRTVYLDPLLPPRPPGNVTADATGRCGGQLGHDCFIRWQVTWEDVAGETGYRVYESRWDPEVRGRNPRQFCYTQRFRRPVLVQTLPANTTRFTGRSPTASGDVGGLVGSKFFVAAFNDAGQSSLAESNRVEHNLYEVPDC